jgi:hypothetical protein
VTDKRYVAASVHGSAPAFSSTAKTEKRCRNQAVSGSDPTRTELISSRRAGISVLSISGNVAVKGPWRPKQQFPERRIVTRTPSSPTAHGAGGPVTCSGTAFRRWLVLLRREVLRLDQLLKRSPADCPDASRTGLAGVELKGDVVDHLSSVLRSSSCQRQQRDASKSLTEFGRRWVSRPAVGRVGLEPTT